MRQAITDDEHFYDNLLWLLAWPVALRLRRPSRVSVLTFHP
jgi:hypothetical protein